MGPPIVDRALPGRRYVCSAIALACPTSIIVDMILIEIVISVATTIIEIRRCCPWMIVSLTLASSLSKPLLLLLLLLRLFLSLLLLLLLLLFALLVVNCQWLHGGCWLLIVGCWFLAVGWLVEDGAWLALDGWLSVAG